MYKMKQWSLRLIPFLGWRMNCYTVCLGNVLAHKGEDVDLLFHHNLTTIPFGPFRYWQNHFAVLGISPEDGIERCLDTLGYSSVHMHFTQEKEALKALMDALSSEPVIIGPVDMGYLTYDPFYKQKRTADHYVVGIGFDEDFLWVDDPEGKIHTPIPFSDFVEAWRAEEIRYKKGPYSMRIVKEKSKQPSPKEIFTKTLKLAAKSQQEKHGPWGALSGSEALEQLARDIKTTRSSRLLKHLQYFTLPTSNQRCFDCAWFLNMVPFTSQRLKKAVEIRLYQSTLYGKASLLAVKGRIGRLSNTLIDIAQLETTFVEEIKEAAHKVD